MNNLDIDTILISVVVILVIVVIIRITVQRYRMSHIKLPAEQIKTGEKPAVVSDIQKPAEKETVASNSIIQEKETVNKNRDDKNTVIKEAPKEEEKVEKTVLQSEKKVEKKEKGESENELDYQELINDPIKIFTNKSLPVKHRIAAIREAGYQKLEKAVPELIKALYDKDVSISLVAAESLGTIGDTRAIDPLLEVSKQNDEELYKAAEEYMGGALVLNGEQPSNNYQTKQNDEPAPVNYKEMVVIKVEQLPINYRQVDGSPIPRKDLVIRGLSDNNEQMRQIAAKAAIGIEESAEIADPLIKALTNTSESESIRAMAAEALGGMGSDKTINALIKALKDDDVAIRYAAAKALSGRSEYKVVQALVGATLDSNKFVRASAAYALGTTGVTSALKALIKCAEDENEVVRFSAVKAISSFKFDDVYSHLVDEQGGLERKSQILAKIEILSQFKDSRVIDVLKRYLSDIDSEITYKASMALMAQENPAVIDDIIDASKQLDQELYRLAKDNLDPEAFFEITKFNSDFITNEKSSSENTSKNNRRSQENIFANNSSANTTSKKNKKSKKSKKEDTDSKLDSINNEKTSNSFKDTLSAYSLNSGYNDIYK